MPVGRCASALVRLTAVGGASMVLAGAALAQSSTVIIAPTAPPPPRVEAVPPPPAAVDAWTPGHWAWGGTTWEWVPGQYVTRPAPQATWVPGHWEAGIHWLRLGGRPLGRLSRHRPNRYYPRGSNHASCIFRRRPVAARAGAWGVRYLGTAASGRVHRHCRAAGRERGAGTERDGGAVSAATASIGARAAPAAGQRPGRVAAGPLGVHRGKDRALELGVRQLCADGTRAHDLDPRPMAADPHWYLGVGHRPLGLGPGIRLPHRRF